MKIAVCVKRVPDMEMRFAIAGDRRSPGAGQGRDHQPFPDDDFARRLLGSYPWSYAGGQQKGGTEDKGTEPSGWLAHEILPSK